MSNQEILTGQYVLLLLLTEDEELTIGKLGTFIFPAGWYAYVGSAFGAGGLTGRLKYHLRPLEKPHWHIDYLRQAAIIQEIWLSPDDEKHEEEWVALMLDVPGATVLVDGFGASGSSQESHLIYFDIRPSLEDFAVGVRRRFPGARVLRAYGTDPAERGLAESSPAESHPAESHPADKATEDFTDVD
ncbi:MAG: GIY-YIG nuclease family protein, partial [Anaerolineae bacterium]|nr:GIY-YIG nuclease family protein [Anaerolineae bacterium]